MKIGFIGVGNMGGPMVRNLLSAGHAVAAYDVAPAALDAVVKSGAEAAKAPGACAVGVEAVITMLPKGAHVRDVYLGPDGVLANAAPGTLLIDCSTIDVDTARAVNGAAQEKGMTVLDAPVSGGTAGAEAGTLTFMVGGDAKSFARAEPILATMGGKIVHAGASGNGQAAKICNNMILGISMIALSESFSLAERLGLDAKTLFEISSNASGSCWAMLHHLPVPGIVESSAANRDFQPGFSTTMMMKDMALAQQAAQSVGASTPLGAQALALYTLFANGGHGDLDYSAIIKLIGGK